MKRSEAKSQKPGFPRMLRCVVLLTALGPVAPALAATYTWTGLGDGKSWNDKMNWNPQDVTSGFNNTAYFPMDVTLVDDVQINRNSSKPYLIISVESGKTVNLTGVLKGQGDVYKKGKGTLNLNNAANTISGQLHCSDGTLGFATIADVGTVCSLGCPASGMEEVEVTGGTMCLLDGNGAYETDRPFRISNATLLLGPSASSADMRVTFNGVVRGDDITLNGNACPLFNATIDTYSNGFGKLGSCVVGFGCENNSFTAQKLTARDGGYRGTMLADKGQPSSFGAGTTFLFGKSDAKSSGCLYYAGTTDSKTDRDIVIEAYCGSSYDSRYGGHLVNESVGTTITFTGSVSGDLKGVADATPCLSLEGVGNGVVAGIISGRVAIWKGGTGTWTLSGANTSEGIVQVTEGRLDVNGSLAATSASGNKVRVASGASLGGTGRIGGATRINDGGIVSPGTESLIGSLRFGNGVLDFSSGSKLRVRFDGMSNDCVETEGEVSSSGAEVELVIPENLTLDPGLYTIVKADVLTGKGFVLGAGAPEGSSLVVDGTEVRLLIPDGGGRQLVWTGNDGALWNKSASSWTSAGAAVSFSDGDAVMFGDDAPNKAVNVTEDVNPLSILVDVTMNDYSFGGSGVISGFGGLEKIGSSTLTLNGTYAWLGVTHVAAGQLVLKGVIDGSSVVVDHGASFVQADSSSSIRGEGVSLSFGYGEHLLAGENDFTGNVVFDTRDGGGSGAAYLRLSGRRPLGRSAQVVAAGYNASASRATVLELVDGCAVSNATLVVSGVGANRLALRKAPHDDAAGWYGDIEFAPNSNQVFLPTCDGKGPLALGHPDGNNEIRYSRGTMIFRGNGRIDVWSRIFGEGRQIERDDSGELVFHRAGNEFASAHFAQGVVRTESDGVFPSTATVKIGKGATSGAVVLDLDGHDLTISGLLETSTEEKYAGHFRTVRSSKSATLTVCGDDDSAFGSSHSVIEGAISFVKSGAGAFALRGSNSMTGSVVVSGGTLAAETSGALGSAMSVVLAGGKFVVGDSQAVRPSAELTVPDGSSGILSVPSGVTLTVKYLAVGNEMLEAGDYAAVASPGVKRLDFMEGEGRVHVRRSGRGFCLILR